MELTAYERYEDQTHITGNAYIEDETGSVIAEGIQSFQLAAELAAAFNVKEKLLKLMAEEGISHENR